MSQPPPGGGANERGQEMTIKDTGDFWQTIESTAYAMEGESADYACEKLFELSDELRYYLFLTKRPKPRHDGPDDFAMLAVSRLVDAMRSAMNGAAEAA
jgi:hypothetical protein